MKRTFFGRFNVGCGPNHIRPEWTNVDIRPFEGVDLVLDVTQAWPCAQSLDFVYGEHFLEHLPVESAFRFLDNAYSALRIGGVLRLTTPSLEWVLSTHFSFEKTTSNEIISQSVSINRAFYGWGHQFLYSKEILSAFLLSSGFSAISFHGYGESGIIDLIGLEQHPGFTVVKNSYGHFPSVWIVEAKKTEQEARLDYNFRNLVAESFLSHVNSGH